MKRVVVLLPLEHDSACLDGPSAPHFPAEDTARSSEIPVSRSDYNRALFEARMGSMQDVELKMPWETGIMKQIFDSDDDSAFPKVLPPVPPDYLMPVSASGAETPDREDMSERPTAKSLVRSDASLLFLFICDQSCARQRHIHGGSFTVGEGDLEVVADFRDSWFSWDARSCVAF